MHILTHTLYTDIYHKYYTYTIHTYTTSTYPIDSYVTSIHIYIHTSQIPHIFTYSQTPCMHIYHKYHNTLYTYATNTKHTCTYYTHIPKVLYIHYIYMNTCILHTHVHTYITNNIYTHTTHTHNLYTIHTWTHSYYSHPTRHIYITNTIYTYHIYTVYIQYAHMNIYILSTHMCTYTLFWLNIVKLYILFKFKKSHAEWYLGFINIFVA